MSLEQSNIISDEEFLKDILGNRETNNIDNVVTPKDSEKELLNIISQGEEKNESSPIESSAKNPSDESGNESNNVESNENSVTEVVEEDVNTPKRFGVRDTISTLVETGEWEDMAIRYGDKEYESIEDLISKEKPTKELFEMLSNAQKEHRIKEVNENYIKLGDRNSIKAKLVDAILNDVPYQDLLEYNSDVVEPLQRIDFANTPNGDKMAEDFVKQCLIEIDNYHPSSVDAAVAEMKRNFKLFEVAEKYQQYTISNFEKEIERRKLEHEQYISQLREQQKQEMSLVREETKKQGISDAFATKILQLRYSQDDTTGLYHYQMLINERMQEDPSFQVDLMHFLLDPADFIAKQKAPVKAEATKKILELVGISKKKSGSGGKASVAKSGNLETNDEGFLRDIGVLKD